MVERDDRWRNEIRQKLDANLNWVLALLCQERSTDFLIIYLEDLVS